jgi:hypothetical protein
LSWSCEDNAQVLYQLYDLLGERLAEFIQVFGGETLRVPAISDLRHAAMLHDIYSTLASFRTLTNARMRKIRMDYEREKAIERLQEDYKIDRKAITEYFRQIVEKYQLSVKCGCGSSTVPGKLVCSDCSKKRSENMIAINRRRYGVKE